MENTVIIYTSTHQGNTRKLVQALCDHYGIAQIDAAAHKEADLTRYDRIGFASGIDFGKFYDPVVAFLARNLPEKKQVFFLYTCARESSRFTQSIKEEARKKGAIVLGEYGCRGYNTYGPWKLIGGMNKNHPTSQEIDGAIRFLGSL